ncbi:MAG: sigma-54-dependent Fis family transcriptional regulator [Planctomycetes bacterium]|nr:sigma-54-dependent Fis family transcriptional regulator [Planctomycetota bacterium]
MPARARILIVDDERYVRESLSEMLSAEGYACAVAGSLSEALEQLGPSGAQVVVSDLKMPGGDGIELLTALRKQGATLPVLMMTGVGTVSDAVRAVQAGAYDFLQKPVDVEQLLLQLARAVEHQALVSEVKSLRDRTRDASPHREIVGSSPAIARVRELIEQVAATDATVLVTGESGTGKELVAEHIHRKSPRASRPLVRVNCAAIPSTLFESEFFGHRRGAFSGAVADRVGRFAEAQGGTLVLDEIGTLPPEMQAKLLRVLENGEYQVVGESRTRIADARVLALTNEALPERVQRAEFRADLFYRLNVFPIAMPPLRAHKEDIAAIAGVSLEGIVGRRGLGAELSTRLAADALEVLCSYDWPGNVRELRNVIERAVILAGGRELDAALFRALLEPSFSVSGATASDDCHLRRNLDALEKQLIQRALERCEGRKKEASGLLGIDARNLGYYLRKHGLADAPPRA